MAPLTEKAFSEFSEQILQTWAQCLRRNMTQKCRMHRHDSEDQVLNFLIIHNKKEYNIVFILTSIHICDYRIQF
jgi:hypothetical protein